MADIHQMGENLGYVVPLRVPAAQLTLSWAGEIVSVHVFGRSVVFLNSHRAASDLLEKRSLIYWSRPVPTMAKLYVPLAFCPLPRLTIPLKVQVSVEDSP
jgi:hypothetical protein